MSKFRTIEISDPQFESNNLRFITVKTPNLKGRGDICVYVPPETRHTHTLPIVILLHGVYGSAWSWPMSAGVHLKVDELIKKDDNTHLVIVGGGTESKALKQYTADLGLSKRVHFTGKINKKYMPDVYSDATIFVFASVSEVHPLVALEACTASLPLIVADDQAFHNIVINDKNGYLIPLQKEQFAKKIRLLLDNKDLQKKMGDYSLTLINKSFPPEQLTEMLLDIYKQVLATKSKERTFQDTSKATLLRLRKTTHLLDRLFK